MLRLAHIKTEHWTKARPQHRELLILTLLNFHFYPETIPINWIKRSTFLLAVNTWRQSIPADKTRLKPDINLPTSVQAAHKVWLYVIPQISWTVLPLGWKTLNLELNFIDNEKLEPSIILQPKEINQLVDFAAVKRLGGRLFGFRCHACHECHAAGSNANAVSHSFLDIINKKNYRRSLTPVSPLNVLQKQEKFCVS